MPTLIKLMKDPSVVVRDTTAWTVGRICELLPEAAINEVYLAPLLQCLIEGLGAEPRVATNVCWVGAQHLSAFCWPPTGPDQHPQTDGVGVAFGERVHGELACVTCTRTTPRCFTTSSCS